MGIQILNRITKMKTTWKLAIASVLLVGLAGHLYKLVNYLPVGDSLYNFYSPQNIVTLGRPFLMWACSISSWFDIPLIEGLFALLWISVTVIILVELFEIQDKGTVILLGGILSVHPTITSAFSYLYTADGYMLSMLLATLGVYLCQKKKRGWIPGCICICLCCGIYQAYLSWALVLLFAWHIFAILGKRFSNRDFIKGILRSFLMVVIGVIAYYFSYNIILNMMGKELSTYQGMSQLSLPFGQLKSILTANIVTILRFMIDGKNWYSLFNITVFLLGGAVTLYIFFSKAIYRNIVQTLFLVLCFMGIIPAICVWMYASMGCSYHSLMLTSLALIPLFVVILCNAFLKKTVLKEVLFVLFAGMILNFCLISNISYLWMTTCYENSYASASQMLYEIRKTDNYRDIKYLVVAGSIDFNQNNALVTEHIPDLIGLTETSLLWDEEHINRFFALYLNTPFETMGKERRNALLESEEVMQMPIWPELGSVAVYDSDTVIIKVGKNN